LDAQRPPVLFIEATPGENGLRERASTLGETIKIESSSGTSARMTLTYPFQRDD
jgi:glucose-6-phosphate-specific signal transduction histidine kinase